jgi:hypothetical protein
MRMKQWVTAVGMTVAVTAGTLAVGAAPASASPLSIVRQGCLDQGGTWNDYGPGERERYSCLLSYPTYYNAYFYLSNGMFTRMIVGELGNGGKSGNIQPK